MAQPVKTDLGAFSAGEVPPPLEVTFTDFDGVVVNLTGFSNKRMNIDEELDANNDPLGTGSVIITDPPNGVVVYTWVKDDMADPGEYTAQLWVDNETSFFASDLYVYSVYDGPGVNP